MPEPELVNPLEIENWNSLLETLPGHSFFHTANWADVLRQSYRYKPFYLCLRTKTALEGLLPMMEVDSVLTGNRGVSLPFSDVCPLPGLNKDLFHHLFRHAITIAKKRKWDYLELRGGEDNLALEKPSAIYWGHKLDLKRGAEKLFSELRNSTRRNIKKAQSEKVDFTISQSLASVKEFCRLNVMTRKEHGLPPQPDKFFMKLHKEVLDRNMGFVALASIHGRPIAANIYLNFGRKVIYKYGASDKTYQSLRANNLIMWRAIQWSCEHHFEEMDFGRTEPEHRGLMQFKDGWGAERYKILYYRYDLENERFVEASQTVNPAMRIIFSKFPGLILKIFGRLLYRHTG